MEQAERQGEVLQKTPQKQSRAARGWFIPSVGVLGPSGFPVASPLLQSWGPVLDFVGLRGACLFPCRGSEEDDHTGHCLPPLGAGSKDLSGECAVNARVGSSGLPVGLSSVAAELRGSVGQRWHYAPPGARKRLALS